MFPATTTDLCEVLLRRHMAADRRLRLLERLVRRMIAEGADFGMLSPQTVEYARRLMDVQREDGQ